MGRKGIVTGALMPLKFAMVMLVMPGLPRF